MYELLVDFSQRPEPFSRYTVKELWTRPHLSKQMLNYHLDESTDLASAKSTSIDQLVDLIDRQLGLANKTLCDLGCGPGLYAKRFSDRGATVTGIDFSAHSLEYARIQADKSQNPVAYIHADYLSDPLPNAFDIVTMIYCDFCVLSPLQRSALLERISNMLNPGGYLVFDVTGVGAFEKKAEMTVIENQLMDGFWAESSYVGMHRCFLFPEISVSLDRYLIIEPTETWEIFNWFQHFTPLSIESELNQAGFRVEQMLGSLSGTELQPESEVIGIIAQKK